MQSSPTFAKSIQAKTWIPDMKRTKSQDSFFVSPPQKDFRGPQSLPHRSNRFSRQMKESSSPLTIQTSWEQQHDTDGEQEERPNHAESLEESVTTVFPSTDHRSTEEPISPTHLLLEKRERGDPKACVFVANLPAQLDLSSLHSAVEHVFSSFGPLMYVKVSKDWKGRPFAFVQFMNERDAKNALRDGKQKRGGGGITVSGRLARLEPAKVNRTLFIARFPLVPPTVAPPEESFSDRPFTPPPTPSSATVMPYTQVLSPLESTESYLKTFLETHFGPIETLHLLRYPKTGLLRGSGFVKFQYREDAVWALSRLRREWGWVTDWAVPLHDEEMFHVNHQSHGSPREFLPSPTTAVHYNPLPQSPMVMYPDFHESFMDESRFSVQEQEAETMEPIPSQAPQQRTHEPILSYPSFSPYSSMQVIEDPRKLFVGNLNSVSALLSEELLWNLFESTAGGSPIDLALIHRPYPKPSFAFVTFGTAEQASKVLECLQGQLFLGRPLRIRYKECRGAGGGEEGSFWIPYYSICPF